MGQLTIAYELRLLWEGNHNHLKIGIASARRSRRGNRALEFISFSVEPLYDGTVAVAIDKDSLSTSAKEEQESPLNFAIG